MKEKYSKTIQQYKGYPHQRGDRFYSSECRRQILTYKDDPRTERIKICIMAVDP